MKGRKPKPTTLKLVTGNPGRRPLNENEPIPEGDLETPPDWFTVDQADAWAYAIENAPLGLLKKIDRGALVVWVVASDLHRRATLALNGELICKGSNGTEYQSPHLAVANRQALIMLKAAAELGFTPSSRTRISVSPYAANETNNKKGGLAKFR